MSTTNGRGKVVVDLGLCDLCDACNAVCPTNAILVDEHRWLLDDEACIECVKCVVVCPVAALQMGREARARCTT